MRNIRQTMVRSLFLLSMLMLSAAVFAQVKVTGLVTDASSNAAMPGVNVVLKGTTTGTVTDVNGNFSISVPDANATLAFSFIGYIQLEVPMNGQTNFNISLKEDILLVDEVVVVGYGTQKKRDLTGAVAVVKTENLEKVTSSDITKLLQGQASGVTVHGSGEPGAAPVIKIRGVGSFQNTEPLYIVDGVPVVGIGDFSPTDIESMQILKDASSCAIYGARGANGVIIITTKRGKKGDMKISYEGSYGIQTMAKRVDVTNREQFQKLNNLAKAGDDLFPAPANDSSDSHFITNINTDWQKEALKNGKINDQTVTFSGGSENSNYNVNLNYFNQDGMLVGPGPKYTRYSGRVNTDQKRNKFKFGQSFYYSYSHQIKLTSSQWGNTALMDIISAIPTVPVYDKNNKGGFGGGVDTIHAQIAGNEVGYNSVKNVYGDRNRFLGNVYGEYEFIKGLSYKINLSYDRTDWFNHEFVPVYNLGTRISNPTAFLKEWRGENPVMLMEHTLTFAREFGLHNLNVMAGYTAQSDYWKEDYAYSEGFTEPYFEVISAGTKASNAAGTIYEHAMISYLGRVNYSYNDKYLLTANFRRDYSSRFGPNMKYGNFPSVSAAWKISNEEFMKSIGFISMMKIRGGYGVIGNEKIGDYRYETYMNNAASYVFGGALPTGTIQTNVADPSIHWEKKTTTNIGVDMAFLKNSVEFSAEYYYNNGEDLLIQAPIPWSVGSVNNPFVNGASMVNKGLEFTLTYRKMEGDVHFDISANISTLKNEVTKIGTNNDPLTTFMSKTEVGHSMGEIYGWDFEGIFQSKDEINPAPTSSKYDATKHAYQPNAKPGDCKFRDVNGDSLINEKDRIYLGSAIPWLTGGINATVEYKGIDLSIFMQGVYGNKAYDGPYQILNNYGLGNYSTETYNNYWRSAGSTNKYPRMTQLDQNGNNRVSQRFVEDASYLKLQSIQLGYNLPKTLFKAVPAIEKVRIYISGQNLLTFTKYRGFDPDFSNDGLLYRGQDYGSFPTPRTYMAGIKMSF